tara:strand:+ start:236 stop:478 length:243 start_codon:yes stop_codon:yes gene_type:complete
MINENEPLITIQMHVLTGELTLNLKNFDSKNGEGYTKDEIEDLISHLQKGIKHLHKCWEEAGVGNLFDEETNGKEKTITR